MEPSVSASSVAVQRHPVKKEQKSTVVSAKVTDMDSCGSKHAALSELFAPPQDGVRLVQLHEWKEAARCLADAFAHDDSAHYFIDTPDRAHWTEQRKWDLHVSILEHITYAHLLKGVVLTAGEDYGCVALWMPPGQNMDDWLTICRSGLWRLSYQLSREGRTRFFSEFLPLLHHTKAGVLAARDHDSWYLVYIGTKEAARGQGLARRVVERVTRVADAERKACYLESSNAKNPSLYRKWGFETARQIQLQRAERNVELEIMVREPAPPAETTSE